MRDLLRYCSRSLNGAGGGRRSQNLADSRHFARQKGSPGKDLGGGFEGVAVWFSLFIPTDTLEPFPPTSTAVWSQRQKKKLAKARTPKFGALFSHIFCLPVGLASINFTISETGPSLARLRSSLLGCHRLNRRTSWNLFIEFEQKMIMVEFTIHLSLTRS